MGGGAWAEPKEQDAGRIRVATFNVYNVGLDARETPEGGRFRYEVSDRGRWLRQWIDQQRLDVVCLNETGSLPMARYLAAGTSLRYYHFDSSRSAYVQPYRNEKGAWVSGYPVTILSRFPILDRVVVNGGDGREMLAARLQVSRTETLWVCAFHAHPAKTTKAVHSYTPVWVKLKDEKAIVCGDFNIFPGAFAAEPFKQLPANGYVDVWQAKHAAGDNGGTYGEKANSTAPPGARIDFIWASASLAPQAISAARLWPTMVDGKRAGLSDHCPVVAEFAVESERGPLPAAPQGPLAPVGTDKPSSAPGGPLSLPLDFENGALPPSMTCTGGTLSIEAGAGNAIQGARSLAWMPTAAAPSTLRIPLTPGAMKDAQWLTFQLNSRQPLPLTVGLTVSVPAGGGQSGSWSGQFAVRPGAQRIRVPFALLAPAGTEGAVELQLQLPAQTAATPLLLDDFQAADEAAPADAAPRGETPPPAG
jgi:exonuclease III